jgi:chemotaxis protein methyltransferase CheR
MAFTYFFRDSHTLELTVKHVVPWVMGRSQVRVWDAGCAHGPEPYSLAIMFAENMGKFAFKNLRIQATDIDQSNLFEKSIVDGVYPETELKRIPKDIFEKYFKPHNQPGCYQIDSDIRSRIQFIKHDLLSLKPVGEGFSLIICKNVLLHFQSEQRIDVIKMFYEVLAPDGFLAVEQTQKLPIETAHLFTQVSSDGQLFRKSIVS